MITGSPSRLPEEARATAASRWGRGTRASSPAHAGPGARVRRAGLARLREQVEGETVSSNYWSSTSNANNPTNAWNVNFNNGNVNNNDKSNNNFVRAVRGGL